MCCRYFNKENTFRTLKFFRTFSKTLFLSADEVGTLYIYTCLILCFCSFAFDVSVTVNILFVSSICQSYPPQMLYAFSDHFLVTWYLFWAPEIYYALLMSFNNYFLRVTHFLWLQSSGPQCFWHLGLVSWKTIIPWTGGGVGMVSGWFRHIQFIVLFISNLMLPLIWPRYQSAAQRLGIPCS